MKHGKLQGTILIAAVVAVGGVAMIAGTGNARDNDGNVDWALKGGSYMQDQYSPLKQVNSQNVSNLGVAWVTEINSPMGLATEPLEVNGVIYMTNSLANIIALDARSGKILWTFDPASRMDWSTQNSYGVRVNRGVAYDDGRVFVATGDCRMVAVSAKTGRKLWDSQVCDPRQTGSTGAPRFAHGKVFVGYNGSDDEVRGSLTAFDVKTGKVAWRFWTVPGDPAKGFEQPALKMAAGTWSGAQWWWHGGGAVWDGITFDEKTGLLLMGTAGAHSGEGTPTRKTSGGDKLFAGSIIAVNVDTGQYVWHYQTSSGNSQTENFHIALADLTIDGKLRHVALTIPKNGNMYVLDAKTGALISSKFIAAGRGNDAAASASGGRDQAASSLSQSAPSQSHGRLMRSARWTVHNWWPMSFNPVTNLVYVPISDRPAGGTTGQVTPEGGRTPLIGGLVAWDPVTQTARWRVAHDLPVNSAVLSTGGNLVFQGMGDGEFAAYAADDGKKLWSIKTGSAIDAVPITYQLDGHQYVLVPVGWGSASRIFGGARSMVNKETKYGPSRLLAFRLGANMTFPYPHITVPRVPQPPAQRASADSIQHGAQLFRSHQCGGCHSPGMDGAGQFVENGAVPDLHYLPKYAHDDWIATVIGGTHAMAGMLSFGVDRSFPELKKLTVAEANDIHAYVIDEEWKAYNKQKAVGK